MVKEQFLSLQLKISHCDMPTTSPRGGPQPPQLAPKSCKKLKKSHPRRLQRHLAVPPLKQAQNLAQEQFLALQLKISHCDMPTTSPRGGRFSCRYDEIVPTGKMKMALANDTAAANDTSGWLVGVVTRGRVNPSFFRSVRWNRTDRKIFIQFVSSLLNGCKKERHCQ